MLFVGRDHRAEQHRVVDHEVVGEQHREGLVADVVTRDRHRVAEAERLALAHVVHVGEGVRVLHFLKQVVLAVAFEGELELEVAVEVVFDGALGAAGDDQDVGEAGAARLPRRRTGSPGGR